MDSTKTKGKKVARKVRRAEELVKHSSNTEEVNVAPKRLIVKRNPKTSGKTNNQGYNNDDETRKNVLGLTVPKKQRPITENVMDDDCYTLATVDSRDEDSTEPTRISIANSNKNDGLRKCSANTGIYSSFLQCMCRRSAIIGITLTLIMAAGTTAGIIVYLNRGNYIDKRYRNYS